MPINNCPGKELGYRGVLKLGRRFMLQQCQRFAELSTGESGLDSERTPGFREFFAAVGLQDEGQVAVAGGGKLEGFLQLHLPCSALQ